ncbi:hypothetical protein HMPREF1051_1511 [Neisseria sicca VK64]|uniref:Uncharacterized protein n=1 Tax=Neisseria sicca VK64 TaxID=1095748 RepID=I2NPV8_NEISI|nr:hypothetical protein HMPREF1051_1511 [Neisseria sicca VK64]
MDSDVWGEGRGRSLRYGFGLSQVCAYLTERSSENRNT